MAQEDCTEHLADSHDVWLLHVHEKAPMHTRMRIMSGLFERVVCDTAFDVIVKNHALEHLISPTRPLRKANLSLVAQDLPVIKVPFEPCIPLLFRKIGDWWHVVYSARDTMLQFLGKTGFAICNPGLATRYYRGRKLPVVQAVAWKVTTNTALPIRGGMLSVARAVLHPRALSLVLASKLQWVPMPVLCCR